MHPARFLHCVIALLALLFAATCISLQPGPLPPNTQDQLATIAFFCSLAVFFISGYFGLGGKP